MKDTKSARTARVHAQLAALGFDDSEIARLKRIESTLRHWATAEANGDIQRREDDGTPTRCLRDGFGDSCGCVKVPDREQGALKRLAAIMSRHPDLWAYHQPDCRGCALYVGKRSDLKTDANQIVRKAREWGCPIELTPGGYFAMIETKGSYFPTEEQAAIAYLESRKAHIPARDMLSLDQHYTRGIAVSL